MPSKLFNFQLPAGTLKRLHATRASTGLAHVANIAWGLRRWLDAGCIVDERIFSEETPGRTQKIIKLTEDVQVDLAKVRQKTGLPLWKVADGAMYYCSLSRPPDAFTKPRNPLLAAVCDEDLVIELSGRGYRVIKD